MLPIFSVPYPVFWAGCILAVLLLVFALRTPRYRSSILDASCVTFVALYPIARINFLPRLPDIAHYPATELSIGPGVPNMTYVYADFLKAIAPWIYVLVAAGTIAWAYFRASASRGTQPSTIHAPSRWVRFRHTFSFALAVTLLAHVLMNVHLGWLLMMMGVSIRVDAIPGANFVLPLLVDYVGGALLVMAALRLVRLTNVKLYTSRGARALATGNILTFLSIAFLFIAFSYYPMNQAAPTFAKFLLEGSMLVIIGAIVAMSVSLAFGQQSRPMGDA